MVQKQNNKLK